MKDEWETPPEVFNWANEHLGPFDFDGAAQSHNSKCENFTNDASRRTWAKAKNIWLNPPYSRLLEFTCLARDWVKAGKQRQIVCLVRFDPSTRYWKIFHECADEILMWPTRIKFEGAKNCYNFPCALVPMSYSSATYRSLTYYLYPTESVEI